MSDLIIGSKLYDNHISLVILLHSIIEKIVEIGDENKQMQIASMFSNILNKNMLFLLNLIETLIKKQVIHQNVINPLL